MNRAALLDLVRYSIWADRTLLDVAARLDPRQLHADSAFFDHRTAFHTFLHLFDVEWSWMLCAQGRPMDTMLWNVTPLPDLAAVRAFAPRFHAELEAYVVALSDADLDEAVNIGAAQGRAPEWTPRLHILLHVVNHGTAHRAELAHFFTSLGHSPGDMDFLDFALNAAGK